MVGEDSGTSLLTLKYLQVIMCMCVTQRAEVIG